MAKLPKQTLTRGLKLSTDDIYGDGPLQQAEETINNVPGNKSFDKDNLKNPWGSFRINWHIPHMSWRWFSGTSPTATDTSTGKNLRTVIFPFTLSPFQEFFHTAPAYNVAIPTDPYEGPTGKTLVNQPKLFLDSFTISFDTRAENRGALERYNQLYYDGIANDNNMYGAPGRRVQDAQRQEMTITLMEKDIYKLSHNPSTITDMSHNNEFKKEIFKFTLAGVNFTNSFIRQNPFTYENINQPLDPYKTYALVFECPFLDGQTDYPDDPIKGAISPGPWSLALQNIIASMRIKTSLHPRLGNDPNVPVGTPDPSTIQNMPSQGGAGTTPGNTQGADIGIIPPAGDTAISAENVITGLQTNMRRVDEQLVDQLDTGMDRTSQPAWFDSITDQACYDVICVPMFGNHDDLRRTDLEGYYADPAPNPNAAPNPRTGIAEQLDPISANHFNWEDGGAPYYASNAAYNRLICDRRIIPLPYPMEIHHVITHANWWSPQIDYTTAVAAWNDPHRPRTGYDHLDSTGQPIHGNIPGRDDQGNLSPTADDIKVSVGVAMGVGNKSDCYTYQNIAAAKWHMGNSWSALDGFPKDNFVIDRIQQPDGYIMNNLGGVARAKYHHELYAIPLVEGPFGHRGVGSGWQGLGSGGGGDSPGIHHTGIPVYVGEGNSASAGFLNNDPLGRVDIGTDTSWQTITAGPSTNHKSYTQGAEQFLEVRMTIEDTRRSLHVPYKYGGPSPGVGLYDSMSQEVLIGAGGHWVYIIGKKYLSGDGTPKKID